MKIASRATPEGLAGHMWPAGHRLNTTALGIHLPEHCFSSSGAWQTGGS